MSRVGYGFALCGLALLGVWWSIMAQQAAVFFISMIPLVIGGTLANMKEK